MRSISASCFSTRSSSELVPVHQLLGLLLQFPGLLLHGAVRRGNFADPSDRLRETARALRIASTAWCAKVCIKPIRLAEISPGIFPQHDQRSEDAGLIDQRYHQHGMKACRDRNILEQRIGCPGEIGYRDGLARCRCPPQQALVLADRDVRAAAGIADSCRLDEIEGVLHRVVAIDQYGVGPGDLQCPGGDRRQHGFEFERRGNRATDLFETLSSFTDWARSAVRSFTFDSRPE